MSATQTMPVQCERFVQSEAAGMNSLHLMVEGVHCGGCVRRIEKALFGENDVESARVNLTTRRLTIMWRGNAGRADRFVSLLGELGFQAVPFDPNRLGGIDERQENRLLRAMAVAGFGAGNVMLLAVGVWAGHFYGMGDATRTFLHWFEALIALPVIAVAGQPFFESAWSALKSRRTNMDVPITIAIMLASAMSLFETVRGGSHVYFDSAVMLLFFLLIGRYLDARARGKARDSVSRMLAIRSGSAMLLRPDGTTRAVPPDELEVGQQILVAAGERIPIDGQIIDGPKANGYTSIDTSLINGEAVPQERGPGDRVFAGTINLGPAIRVMVKATGDDTLLADIIRLMEFAEQRRGRFVNLADRIARLYAPVVHGLAALTFIGWLAIGGIEWQTALLYAIAVLIITCPCALGLAVPVVQVIASGRLVRRGILLKSPTALERLANVDTVVFDKTGTITTGNLTLKRTDGDDEALLIAGAMARSSRHPLARAVAAASADVPPLEGVEEVGGCGLRRVDERGEWRLGRREWAGVHAETDDDELELWLTGPDRVPHRFCFDEQPRADAAMVVDQLKASGKRVVMLSGDRRASVERTARLCGVEDWHAEHRPDDKVRLIEALAERGRRILMVGDGLNDAPALAAAHVSLSPANAADISQNAADAVFQGERLKPVTDLLGMASRSEFMVKQNLAMALAYNVITIPLAVAGLVTPLIAALSMSASSIIVVANALRLNISSLGVNKWRMPWKASST
jgi:Cu2+-exporting ATPase